MHIARSAAKCSKLPPLGAVSAIVCRADNQRPWPVPARPWAMPALATGTKVKIDNYGQARDGISVALLADVGFAHMKHFGATHVSEPPGKPQGYEETGSVSSVIPGIGFVAYTSKAANHTYEMEADALTSVGHQGFAVARRALA
jgi:hypothetical protein